jgi:hypothetical protein
MMNLSWIKKLKSKWGIKTNTDFWLIMLVFSLAGMTIGPERHVVFHFLGLDPMPMWVKVLVYVPLIFPLYQLNLLVFGFLLGQFDFFLEKEKKLVQFLAKSFRNKPYKT